MLKSQLYLPPIFKNTWRIEVIFISTPTILVATNNNELDNIVKFDKVEYDAEVERFNQRLVLKKPVMLLE